MELFKRLRKNMNPYTDLEDVQVTSSEVEPGYYESQLIKAAEEGDLRKVTFYLEQGADVNAVDKKKNSALLLAAYKGYIQIVYNLLNAKADINQTDAEGETSLHLAVLAGHNDIVSVLLDHGANLEAEDDDGDTPLILASENGHKQVAQLLLRAGAKIEARNIKKDNALILASFNGEFETVMCLLAEGANTAVIDGYDGDSPLHLATNEGYVDVVKGLLAKGANPLATNELNETALDMAASQGRIKVVNLLIEHLKANDADSNIYQSALHSLIQNFKPKSENQISVVKLILEKIKTINLNEALIHAAEFGAKPIVEILLSTGANPNAANSHGFTALHYATNKGDSQLVSLLLNEGADKHLLDIQARTPEDVAREREHFDVCVLLQKTEIAKKADTVKETQTDENDRFSGSLFSDEFCFFKLTPRQEKVGSIASRQKKGECLPEERASEILMEFNPLSYT